MSIPAVQAPNEQYTQMQVNLLECIDAGLWVYLCINDHQQPALHLN